MFVRDGALAIFVGVWRVDFGTFGQIMGEMKMKRLYDIIRVATENCEWFENIDIILELIS